MPAAAEPAKTAAPRETLRLNDLKDLSIQKLTQIAKDKNVVGATGMRKQDLIFNILKAQTEQSGFIFSEGVLEVLPDGFGFLVPDDGGADLFLSPKEMHKTLHGDRATARQPGPTSPSCACRRTRPWVRQWASVSAAAEASPPGRAAEQSFAVVAGESDHLLR